MRPSRVRPIRNQRSIRSRTEPGQSAPSNEDRPSTTRSFARKVGGVDGTRPRGLRRDRPATTESYANSTQRIPNKDTRNTRLFRPQLWALGSSSRTEDGQPPTEVHGVLAWSMG